MDAASIIDLLIKLSLTVVLAGIIGYERERIHRPAGLRTHIIVGIGALIFSIISVELFPDDPARVISNIVTGIGFLGAGTIFREKDLVKGLTTAASLWATASVGVALALGEYALAVIGSLAIFLVLDAKNLPLVRRLFWNPQKASKRSRSERSKGTRNAPRAERSGTKR
jgi:putative Mg2+ transporter-C (MgtC) family protein